MLNIVCCIQTNNRTLAQVACWLQAVIRKQIF